MERKIGEIFEYNGEWYQCVEGLYCDNCAFVNDNCEDRERITLREKLTKQPTTGFCNSEKRNDRKSVIFKKLEKVGEPFSNEHFGLVQKYELKRYGYSTKDKRVCFVDGYDVFIKIKQNKEDMEEKKLNLKPFDLEEAKEGKPVCTRDGRKARIICFDKRGGCPIIALVETFVVEYDCIREETYYYTIDGREIGQNAESKDDLMMLHEKKEGWVNVYKKSIYKTKEEAFNRRDKENYLMTIKVDWEE